MSKELYLIKSTAPENQQVKVHPSLEEILNNPEGLAGKLMPVIQFDGAIIRPSLAGIPFCFFVHDVSGDAIELKLENGKYTVLKENEYRDPTKFDEIEAWDEEDYYITDDAEYLQVVDKEPSFPDREIATLVLEKPIWLQSDYIEILSDPGEWFVAQLFCGNVFGSYYLFFDKDINILTQMFECT